MIIQFLLLAKSSKSGNYCVAGIDLTNHRYIRLVSNDTSISHSISKDKFKYKSGRSPRTLNVLEIEISDDCLYCDGAQKENYLWKGNCDLKFLYRKEIKDIEFPSLSLLPFGSADSFLDKVTYDSMDHSIEVLHVKNLSFIQSTNIEGSPRKKVSFVTMDEVKCEAYSMTDANYFNDDVLKRVINEAYILVSIPTSESNQYSNYYKFVAAIHEVN